MKTPRNLHAETTWNNENADSMFLSVASQLSSPVASGRRSDYKVPSEWFSRRAPGRMVDLA
jgi:hypothetical protein